MSIQYRDRITAEEVNRLRAAIGFRQIAPAQLNAGLQGSGRAVSAYDGDRAVGMARLLWDGGTTALITDAIVLPEYEAQGLRREIMAKMLDFLRAQLEPGFGIQVDVRAWGGQEALYAGLGFQPSAQARRGLPMHICLTNQMEITDRMFHQGDDKE